MAITGIICEYNPFHLGHKKQFNIIRAADPDGAIVCLMSGNYVQRGTPAIFDKIVRAKAAVLSGADLVLELPVNYALRSAEGFAAGGVEILSRLCNALCFGTETADASLLMQLAKALLSPEFTDVLHKELDKGLSFPAARQAALDAIGLDTSALSQPNTILAVEYCKAILSQNSPLTPNVILREGSYHDTVPDRENPSATAIRTTIEANGNWKSFIPEETVSCYETASVHHVQYAEHAILARLRTMTDEEFAALPFGSEGLWRKLMHAARQKATIEEIIHATKSKRYTRTRIDRMILCAYLGITEQAIDSAAPYIRILAFNDKGRSILSNAKKSGTFVNIGECHDDAMQLLEDRCDQLYGLFAQVPEPKTDYRVYYQR